MKFTCDENCYMSSQNVMGCYQKQKEAENHLVEEGHALLAQNCLVKHGHAYQLSVI